MAEAERYFDVSVDESTSPPLVTAAGELDAASSSDLGAALEQAMTTGDGVTLELGDVTFIDSSGLRVITIALRRARDEDQPFDVASTSDAVRKLFEMTGVSSLLAP